MKNLRILFMILMVLTFTIFAFSQDVEMSDSSISLAEKIKTEGGQAILDAGDTGDQTLIPYLRSIAKNSKTPWAQIALAKLGDKAELDKILKEFDADLTDESFTSIKFGMHKLSLVKGKIAFKKFYEVLNQLKPLPKTVIPSNLNNKQRKNIADKYNMPGVYLFLNYLGQMVKDPPKLEPNSQNKTTDLINLWKEWFAKHKELIE